LANGYQNYDEYVVIEEANQVLTELLEESGLFSNVLRGYPENIKIFQGAVATTYIQSLDFESFMGEQNIPNYMYVAIIIVLRGSKQATHDKSLEISLELINKFHKNDEWRKLKGKARHTEIESHNMFPEMNKDMGLYFTTSIIELKHHIIRHKGGII